MNTPIIDDSLNLNEYSNWVYYLEFGIMPIKISSFVSCLINKKAIKMIGFPISDFFIWGDDTEYTQRISDKLPCYIVGKSIVCHKREIQKPPSIILEENKDRIYNYFYKYRNDLYLSKKRGFYFFLKILILILRLIIIVLFNKKHPFSKAKIILNAIFKFIFFNPKINFPADS